MQEEGQIVEILIDEFGATLHPHQADAYYVLENLPFHAPRQMEDHVSILSLNNCHFPMPW